jgi:hypothetical protein
MNPPATTFSERRTFLVLAGVGGVHLALTAAGLPGWPCPFRMAFGLPCPGCGLTRATVALLHGDWAQAMKLHAFAPLAVVALGGVIAGTLLPAATCGRLAAALIRLDARFRLGWVLLGALLIYWLARFYLDGPAFRQLAT